MITMLLELLGVIAGLLLLSSSIPQLREALTQCAEGVSIGTWALFLASASVWTAYGTHIQSAATIIANIGGIVTFGLLVATLLRLRTGKAASMLAVPVGVAGLVGTGLALPTAVVGWIGVAVGCSIALPQLAVSWRRRDEPTKVSVGAWTLVISGQSLWLVYGLLRPDVPITVVNLVALTAGIGVLALALRGQRREREAGPTASR